MRLAVLASANSWYLGDLRRAAADQHEVAAVSFRDLASWVERDRVQVTSHIPDGAQVGNLEAFEAVLIRTMPPGSLEQIVFRMDVLGALESRGILVVNPPRTIEAAVDKFLALARLSAAGLSVPRTFVCQTVEQGLEAFDQLGADVIHKPLFGSEGRGMVRIVDRRSAERTFRFLVDRGDVLYLQEYIEHPGYDVRVLLIGDRAFALRRYNAVDWRTNLSLGGRAEPIAPSDEIIDEARRAARAVGALVAGIDLIEDKSGTRYVLEVNAVPGWKASARALGIDVARLVLEYLARLVERRRGG